MVSLSNSVIIINYLPYSFTREELEYMFSRIGDIVSCIVMRDFSSGNSLGYGFVIYHSSVDADRAIEILNGLKIENKTLKVSYASIQKEIKNEPTTLFVYNIAPTVTHLDLVNLFRQYGEVREAKIHYARSYAFVTMDNEFHAMGAIGALNLIRFHNRILQVRLKQFRNFWKKH